MYLGIWVSMDFSTSFSGLQLWKAPLHESVGDTLPHGALGASEVVQSALVCFKSPAAWVAC